MVCERIGKKIDAVTVCNDCSDLLCANCTDYHKAIKSTSLHVVSTLGDQPVDINSVKTFKITCSEHRSKELELYCEEHKIPCCSMCVSIHHRKCEKVLSLEDAAKGFATSGIMKNIKKQLDQVEEDINSVITDRKACLGHLESQYESEKKKLENIFDDLIAKVSSLKAKRGAELLKVYNEVRENVETTLTIFQNKQKIVENEKQILDISLKRASEVQLMIEVNKFKDKIEKHKELIHKTSDKIMEYAISIKNEQELSDILNKLNNVCQISCNKKQKSLVFVGNVRQKQSQVYRMNRFKNVFGGWRFSGNNDAIKFSISKEIEMFGFLSYGCDNGSSTCQVTASVNDGTNDIITVTSTLDSKLADDKLLQINFPKPIKLAANTDYHAVVGMKGPACNNGGSGMPTVDCNDVTFTFKNSEMDANSTCVGYGQIPGFLFRL